MKESKEISVLMAVYNEPIEWVQEAVNSILGQSFSDFELIIVLDNPLYKEFIFWIDQLNDKRVLLIINEKNLGLTKSLNIGLKVAKGKFIARMDADDISLQNRFEKQIALMKGDDDLVVCGGWIEKIGDSNGVVRYVGDPEEIMEKFTFPNPYLSPIAHPTAFIRKEFLEKNNLSYNEMFKVAQDYGLWNEILKCDGKISNVQEPLLLYRISSCQITKTKRDEQLKTVKSIILDHCYFVINRSNVECNSIESLFNCIKINVSSKNNVADRKKYFYLYYALLRFCGFLSLKNILFLCLHDTKNFVSIRYKLSLFRLLLKR